MKVQTALILGSLIVLVVLVIYAAVRKPTWSDPSFWLANFVETPQGVYRRSGGGFDDEAALALDRATGGRDPGPADHLLAATIITRNILGQEHRPETDARGRPTGRALERARLRRDMLVQAREHYMAALRGLNRQAGAPRAAAPPRAAPQPAPPEAGHMIDAALGFAVGGMVTAMRNDPLLAAMFGQGPNDDLEDVYVQMQMGLIDMDLAGAANHTREQVVEQRRGAAAAAAGGAPGATAERFLDLSVAHTDDPENSHDPGVNGCLRGIMARLRRAQEGAPLPALGDIEHDIRANWMAYVDGDQKALGDVLAVVERARAGEKSVAIDATDEEVLRRIWARADAPENAANREKLRRASVDALKDSWKSGIGGRHIVCVNGRTSRQFGSLSTLDHDAGNWEVSTLEQFKNDVFEKTKALIREESEAAAKSEDPAAAKVGRSFLAASRKELEALGDVDPAANDRFVAAVQAKIAPMVDAYVADVNARTGGAIPAYIVPTLKTEASAAVG